MRKWLQEHRLELAQVMVWMLIPIAFLLPFLLGKILWPSPDESPFWKVAAILLGVCLFVGLKATYAFFGHLLVRRQAEAERGQNS